MTIYYVGKGGNDGNNGQTWAQRKLTLTGAEDIPVVGGDTVYVGPGSYNETLTVDVSGGSGTEITYIGDVTGIHTDLVGGIVRVTGSANNQTAVNARCIYASGKDYRNFYNFTFDMVTTGHIQLDSGCDHWNIFDCYFGPNPDDNPYGIYANGSYDNIDVKRCIFIATGAANVYFYNASDQAATSCDVEDCLFVGSAGTAGYGLFCNNVDSVSLKNCTFVGMYYGVRTASLAGSTSISVYNSIFQGCRYGCYATTSGEITEDYCAYYANDTNFYNDSIGANSVAYATLFEPALLYAGIQYPWGTGSPFHHSQWSDPGHKTGSSETTTDLFGITKPATAAISSWGAIQFQDRLRETGTTRGGSTASIKFETAGEIQIWVPVENTEITVSVYCYREANYAGTNPRLVIKQPGQADRTTTDAAAASQWNQLTDTFTPSADTDYIIVCLQSLNTDTANAATNDAFFDDLTIS